MRRKQRYYRKVTRWWIKYHINILKKFYHINQNILKHLIPANLIFFMLTPLMHKMKVEGKTKTCTNYCISTWKVRIFSGNEDYEKGLRKKNKTKNYSFKDRVRHLIPILVGKWVLWWKNMSFAYTKQNFIFFLSFKNNFETLLSHRFYRIWISFLA